MKDTLPCNKSGFCTNGQHEGTRPLSASGKPMKVCVFWQTCACDCHSRITEMYNLTGLPRVEVGNPEYLPYENKFWMPDYTERVEAAQSRRKTTPAKELDGSEEPVFVETDSGRIPKGQLEYWVKLACQEYMQAPFDITADEDVICTPAYLSEKIALDQGVSPPSQGAIHAVLTRWEKIGYVILDRDPMRFISLTVDGLTFGLDVLKIKASLSR